MKQKNIRCCVSCRKKALKNNLWRVVRCHATGVVQIGQGMGRSAYLCPTEDCLMLAQKKRRLSRSLRTNVQAEIYQSLLHQLND